MWRKFQEGTGNTRFSRKMYSRRASTCLRIYKGKHTTRPRAKSVTSITTARSLSAVSLVVSFSMILELFSRTILMCLTLRSATLDSPWRRLRLERLVTGCFGHGSKNITKRIVNVFISLERIRSNGDGADI